MAGGPDRSVGDEDDGQTEGSGEDGVATAPQEPQTGGQQVAAEWAVACTSCRRVKAFCDRLNPCTRCKRLGTQCVPQQTRRGRPPKTGSIRLNGARPGSSSTGEPSGANSRPRQRSRTDRVTTVTGDYARRSPVPEVMAVPEAAGKAAHQQAAPERPIDRTPHALISFEKMATAIVKLRMEDALDQAMLDHLHDFIDLYYQEVTPRVQNCIRHACWDPTRGLPPPRPAGPVPVSLLPGGRTRLEEEQLHWINIGWMQELLETMRAYSCCIYFLPGGPKTICNDLMTRDLISAERLQRETDRYRSNDLHSLSIVVHRDSLTAFYEAVIKSCFGKGMLQEEHRSVRVVRKNGEEVLCLVTVRSVHHASQPAALGCSVRFWPLREMVDFSEFNPTPESRRWVDGDSVG